MEAADSLESPAEALAVQLEADGPVIRTVFPEVPPHMEYSLSGLGKSMHPIIEAMEAWGTEYKKYLEEKSGTSSPADGS